MCLHFNSGLVHSCLFQATCELGIRFDSFICPRILSWILWAMMQITKKHKHQCPSLSLATQTHHQAISRTSSRRATSSSMGFLFICKIVKSLCHKYPARRTYLHECYNWGWLPGRWVISGPGRKVSSSSCRYHILKPVFWKLSLGYVVFEKWFSSKSRHNTAPLQEKANGLYHLINMSHQSILTCPLFWSNSYTSHLSSITIGNFRRNCIPAS